MTIRKVAAPIMALLAVVLLGGCSVGMAVSGDPAPNLTNVRKDAYRSDVELALGTPVRTSLDSQGRDVAVYQYEVGNEPSAGRAVGHAVMDVLTLGIWEIVGTPIEAVQGDKYEMTVVYGEDDRVVSISSTKISSST